MRGSRPTRLQRAIDRQRGKLAVFYRNHSQILAAADAIAAGPDSRDRRSALAVYGDARTAQLEQVASAVQSIAQQNLANRFEQHVGGQRKSLAGSLHAAALVKTSIFELHGGQ